MIGRLKKLRSGGSRTTIAPRRRPCVPSKTLPADGPAREAIETSRNRLLITGAVVLFAFGCVGLRLVDLTLLQPAEEPRLNKVTQSNRIETERVDIVDRHGAILATGLATASLYANPRRVIDPEEAARQVATVLPDVDVADLTRRMKTDREFIWLHRKLTPRQQWQLLRLGIPGLDFQREEARMYPHGNLMSHILGFTDVDNHGLAGVEKSLDNRLRNDKEPLELTIDVRLQHIMHTALADAMKTYSAIGASGVILDIRNGEVLSLVSLPDFDPYRPGSASESQLRNRATQDVYELGSAFKIFTTASALDAGVVEMDGGYDATKPIRIARHVIRDYHAKRRWLSVPEIFMYSSNIGAAKMAMDVGTEAQQEYLARLGLLSPSPVELPEVGAPIKPRVWRTVTTMTVSFGHGIAVSPLQMSSAVAAVMNDGMYVKPTLIKRDAAEAAPERTRVFSRKTSHEMRRLLRLVVEQGTGKRADAEGYLVGGKTGTAEKQFGGRYARNKLISSFIGAFPINAPRYLVLAVLDEPNGTKATYNKATGGWVAAPVVKQVVERMGPLVGMRPVDTDSPELRRELAINVTVEGRTLASF
ncbi:MAG: penicillin-binding protein 2 [Pseudomonadota bacterium]